jgi:hypothetical protein
MTVLGLDVKGVIVPRPYFRRCCSNEVLGGGRHGRTNQELGSLHPLTVEFEGGLGLGLEGLRTPLGLHQGLDSEGRWVDVKRLGPAQLNR